MRRLLPLALIALVVSLAAPSHGSAQLFTSVGGGITHPTGDFGDGYDRGFTARGLAGLDLLLVDVFGQVGINRFAAADTAPNGTDDLTMFQVGAGGRLSMGLLFVGASANYYFGSDVENEVGIAPEVGIGLLMVEGVLDYRITGDAKFASLRVALKF